MNAHHTEQGDFTGNGRWYVGNCIDVMKTFPDEIADMIITSPPYDNLRDYNGYSFDFEGVAKEISRILKNGRSLVWIVNDAKIDGSETLSSFKQAIFFVEECGLKLNDTMIWNKGTFTAVGALRRQYAPAFEYMFVFTKGDLNCFNPIKDKPNRHFGGKSCVSNRLSNGEVKKKSKRVTIGEYGQRLNVWDMPAEKTGSAKWHPARFPVSLVEDHIRSWSNKDDTILDPFMGSGTTAIAAEKTGRKWIGIEISEDYTRKAQKRICDFLKEEGGV